MPITQRLKQEFSFIKGNYAVLVLSWVLLDFASEIPTAYYALYVLGLGATETILGTIGLFQFLALASMQFPGGYIADKFGRKWIICLMTFGVALSYLFYALAPSWHFILIGAVLMAVFNSTYQPALMAMIADSLPPEKRGMGFGIVTLIGSASTTPGPVVAALLYSRFGLMDGMRVGYGIVVALFLSAAFLRVFKLKETLKTTEKPHISDLWKNYPAAVKQSLGVWKKVSRSLFYLVLSLVIIQFGFSASSLFFPVYAVNDRQIDKAVWALLTAAAPVTTIIFSIPIGKFVDKINRKIPMLLAYSFFGLATWLFVEGNVPTILASLVLVGASQVMINTGFSALLADLTPKMERGKVNAFTNFVSFIFMALGNFIGGFLYEHVSHILPFYITIITIVPSFLITLALVKEPEKREE
ncbi:MAG: MFS transporter [Candidatus Bathyarchaeia archaeon]